MNKTLRFSLLSMLMMLCGSVFAADDVTINASSLSGIADNTPITVNGYTFTALKNNGSTAPTYNTNGGDVRLYAKNTLTIKAASGNMSKITFNISSQGKKRLTEITASTGSIAAQALGDETVTWTGNANEVTFTVGDKAVYGSDGDSKAGQFDFESVVFGEGGDTPGPGPDPQDEEIKVVSIAEFNAAAESTNVWYQLSGTVSNLKDGDEYGNFDLTDETGSVYVYGLLSEKGGAKKLFQELAAEKGIKNGTKITLIGNRGSYQGKIEVTNAYFVSVDGQGDTPDPQPEETKIVTIAEFNAAAESTNVWYQLSGTVSNLKDGDEYGNFDLTDETGSVYVYGLLSEKGGAKKLFQELAAEKGIKNGTKITLIGNRGSYQGKIEVTNAYFVSVDGQGDTPDPQPDEIKDATVAEFNAAAESTSVWYKLKGEVKNLKDGDKYGNFDLEDATGSVYVYGLLSEKGGMKEQFQALAAEKGIKNGCKITIIGNRGSYNDKIEVLNAYFVSVDEAAPAELTISGETTFEESTIVTIIPSDVDHDVYYTLDGTDPKTSSTQKRYMEPFTIKETCTVKAWEEDADIYAEKTFTKKAIETISVEDVIAAAPESSSAAEGQEKVWVKGYIVGFVEGQVLATGAKFTNEGCETKSNLLIATKAFETDLEKCIPIQLPAGVVREGLNLQDNPDNFGKEVMLLGHVLKYFGVPGMRNVTEFRFTGNNSVELLNVDNMKDGKMYNIAGQRVNDSFKGIVIMNGKKFIVK